MLEGFIGSLVITLHEDSAQQRLWYDLRVQSLFEESFRADVAAIDQTLESMVWRILSRYAELSGRELILSSSTAYAIFDGVFSQAVLSYLSERDGVEDELAARIRELFPKMLAG